MPTYSYLLGDESSIHFSYTKAEQGVVVLKGKDNSDHIIPSADIHATLCEHRFLKDEIDTEVMPIIYPCEVEGNMIPLYQLHKSVKARYENENHNFNKIFRSDLEIKHDRYLQQEQKRIENEKRSAEKKKQQRMLDKFHKQKEQEAEKQLKTFCKENGIPLPKKRDSKEVPLKYKM